MSLCMGLVTFKKCFVSVRITPKRDASQMPAETVFVIRLVPAEQKQPTGLDVGAVQVTRLFAALADLGVVYVQRHLVAVVTGHHMSPAVGLVALVSDDSGGFERTIRAKGEEKPAIFSSCRVCRSNTDRPAFLAQGIRAVVKHA